MFLYGCSLATKAVEASTRLQGMRIVVARPWRICTLLLLCQSVVYGGELWSVEPGGEETVRSALAKARDGDEVVIAQGRYTGPENCGLVVSASNIVVRGDVPGGAVIMDCSGSRRHLVILGSNVEIRDIHFFNGSAAYRQDSGSGYNRSHLDSIPDGGCVLVLGEESLLHRVQFSHCSAGVNASGGAVR
jgi:hypothetical protein